MKFQTLLTAFFGILAFSACAYLIGALPSNSQVPAYKGTQPDSRVVNDPKFHARLLEIAEHYSDYYKVDDLYRWAPELCMFPAPPKARLSKSSDAQTHGKKLYYLFAKHRNEYIKNEFAAGQVVVKEAWQRPSHEAIIAAEADIKSRDGSPAKPIEMFPPDVLGLKSELYIMYNTDSKTPDTDDGWVYGTVTADGKTVTSAGRVQSCMECHASAPYGRLFGLKK